MQNIERYNSTLEKIRSLLDPNSRQFKESEAAATNARILYEALNEEVSDLVNNLGRIQEISDTLDDKTDIIIRQTILETSVPEVAEYLEATKKFKSDLPFLLLKLQLEVEEKAANLAVLMQNYHLADTNFKNYQKQCGLLRRYINKSRFIKMTIGQIKEFLEGFIDETGKPLFNIDELYDFIEIVNSTNGLERKEETMVEVEIPDEVIKEYGDKLLNLFNKAIDEKMVEVDIPDEDIAEYCRRASEVYVESPLGEEVEPQIVAISLPDEEGQKLEEEAEDMVDLDKAMVKDSSKLSANGQMLLGFGKEEKDIFLVDNQLAKMSKADVEANITAFEDAGIDLETVKEHIANVLYLQKLFGKDTDFSKLPILLCNISNDELVRRLKEAAEYFIGVEDVRDIKHLAAPSDLSSLLADTVEMYGDDFENLIQGRRFSKIVFPNYEEMAIARENSKVAFKKYFGEDIDKKLEAYKEGESEPDLFVLTDLAEKIALTADEIRPGYYKVGGHWMAKSRIENNLKRILSVDFGRELDESEIIEMAITYGSLSSVDLLATNKTLGGAQ